MAEAETTFDQVLKGARDLGVLVITGRLWPPRAGALWIGDQSLTELLAPYALGNRAALGIIAGGPGWTDLQPGTQRLDAGQIAQLRQLVAEAGGTVYLGRLQVLTPARWLTERDRAPADADPQAALEAARASGWPADFDDDPVLFLDEQPVYHLLARENIGRNMTLLVGVLDADG
jgi:hypothetical protein